MSINLKYGFKKNSYNKDVVYVCTDDHKCSTRGCKIDLDSLDPSYVTVPFDYTKKYCDGNGNIRNFYCIYFNWNSKSFGFIPDFNTYIRGEIQGSRRFTSLTKQFYIRFS